jgi:hypothetical protein
MPNHLSPRGDADRLAAAVAEVNRLDPIDLLALYYVVQSALPAAEFPRLIVGIRTVTDDGETYQQRYLQCPHCDQVVTTDDEGDAEDLIAVDIDERWTGNATVDFDDRDVQWNYDGDTEYEGFIYKHSCNKPVRLPEDWTER